MSQEELQALNTEGEVTPTTPTPEVEQETTEPEAVVDQPEQQESGKGASQRIRELNNRAKKAESEVKNLKEKFGLYGEESESVNPFMQPDFQYEKQEPIVKPGEDITAEELEARLQAREQRILKQADAMSRFRFSQQQVYDRVKKEASEVQELYPQLNPNRDDFDPELSTAITDATEAFVKSNPTGSIKTFVKNLMKPYQKSIDKEVDNQKAAIVKQAYEGAVRPTTISKTDKPFRELSIKEMEEKLGIVY